MLCTAVASPCQTLRELLYSRRDHERIQIAQPINLRYRACAVRRILYTVYNRIYYDWACAPCLGHATTYSTKADIISQAFSMHIFRRGFCTSVLFIFCSSSFPHPIHIIKFMCKMFSNSLFFQCSSEPSILALHCKCGS